MDPRLARIDVLLDDETLVESVFDALKKRFPHSTRRGRRGTPAEVALRLLVLKHLKDWSYEELEWEVKGNLVYRHFCRVYAGKVPDAKTMVRLGQLLEGDALRAVFERVVSLGAKARVAKGRRMRIDTTVVEANVRYPSDSRLCEDVTESVCREIQHLQRLGVAAPAGFSVVRRSVRRRSREITAISRRPVDRAAKRRALQRPYRRLLAITRRALRQAKEVTARITRMRRPLCGHARRAASSLARIVKLGTQVVRQTKARILGGSTVHEKIVSIFEPTTIILRRGKPGRPTEFGQMVKVQEAENGLITDIGVVHTTDHALLVPAVERHAEVFGLPPRVATTDRGFYSHKGVDRIEAMGVACAAIPKTGFRSPAVIQRERKRSFRKARAWRAGGEARISRLKNTFGMRRTRYKGANAIQRSAHWAAIANNLLVIAKVP